jgi:carbon-monoxide dehydrogenase large subunit
MRFLRGQGRYVDDLGGTDAAQLVMLRSPHASARITRLDASKARGMPGVLLVLTPEDIEELGVLRCITPRLQRNGSPLAQTPWRMLAMGQVRYVGDAVAAVIATSRAAAQDAAEAIFVEYEPLPTVTDVAEAIKPEAPQLWPDLAQENESVLFRLGDRAAVDAAFARAAHVTRFDFRITRVSANPLEPRNALASYDPVEERYTLTTGTQLPHVMRNEIAEYALKIPSNRLRIISPDVGGGFGMKESPFQEHVLALHGAKRLGRPVRPQRDHAAQPPQVVAVDDRAVIERGEPVARSREIVGVVRLERRAEDLAVEPRPVDLLTEGEVRPGVEGFEAARRRQLGLDGAVLLQRHLAVPAAGRGAA